MSLIKKPDFVASIIPDHPLKENIPNHHILIVGGKGYKKWVYFRCPCGCNEIIMLSLSKTGYPRWSIKIDALKRPTISPSIRLTSGCRSHFWVRKGNVIWCKL